MHFIEIFTILLRRHEVIEVIFNNHNSLLLKVGTHGVNCGFQCACLVESTDSCDHVTGECLCKPGYKGKLKHY